MINNLILYLELTWLCFRLLISLLFFSLTFLLKKINANKIFIIFLFILLISIWIFNFYIFNKKNTPKVDLEGARVTKDLAVDYLKPRKEIIREEELKEKLEYYKYINEMNVKSPNLFLNLAQLSELNKDTDLGEMYLNQALQIEPKIKNP